MAARQLQYDDFVPKVESQDQPEATLLLIHLPDFTREQVRVSYVHSTRTLRVTGERPLTTVLRKRFNQGFPVPANCHVDKIHGSFKNGVLTITMPKQTFSKVPQDSRSEKETKLPEASKAPSPPEPEHQKKRYEEYRGDEKLGSLEDRKPGAKKLPEESRGRERATKMEEMSLLEGSRARERPAKLDEKNLIEESRARERAAKLEEKNLLEESKWRERPAKLEEKNLLEESKWKERPAKLEEKMHVEDSKGKEVAAKLEEKKLAEEGKEEEKKKVVPEVSYKRQIMSGEGEKEKGIMEKIMGKETTREDKKLMVNIGVAALVIFALGAYVSYTFTSPSSASASKAE